MSSQLNIDAMDWSGINLKDYSLYKDYFWDIVMRVIDDPIDKDNGLIMDVINYYRTGSNVPVPQLVFHGTQVGRCTIEELRTSLCSIAVQNMYIAAPAKMYSRSYLQELADNVVLKLFDLTTPMHHLPVENRGVLTFESWYFHLSADRESLCDSHDE